MVWVRAFTTSQQEVSYCFLLVYKIPALIICLFGCWMINRVNRGVTSDNTVPSNLKTGHIATPIRWWLDSAVCAVCSSQYSQLQALSHKHATSILLCQTQCSYTSQWAGICHRLRMAPSEIPFNTWLHEPILSLNLRNGIEIGSAIWGCAKHTQRQTYRLHCVHYQ